VKICHVITRLILGGAQENTLATVLGLAARGHDLTLVAGPTEGPEGALFELAPGLRQPARVRVILEPHLVRPLRPWHDVLAWLRLARHFRAEQYDIVHTHSSKAGVIGRLAARGMRRRGVTTVVHTIHGLAFDQYQPAHLNALYIGVERLCSRHSDALVSVCDAMTRQALDAGIGTPGQYHTIYSGFDLEAFRAARDNRLAARAHLGIPVETLTMLHVGRLFPMKGAEDFIRAVAHARAATARPVLGLVVGDGPLRGELERSVRDRGLADAVRFAGLVPPTRMPLWLAAADMLVHASMREGLARAVVQALAAGVPAIAYDIGGVREVVRDGTNGYVCPPGNCAALAEAAARLAADDALRSMRARDAAATPLLQFASDTMVAAIEQLYRELRSGVME